MNPSLTRRKLIAASILPAFCGRAFAQGNWPSRPLKFIIPVPPGGTVDLFARTLADRLTVSLGQPVVVDNRAGAGGLLGTKALSGAAPDGYTFGYVHSGLATVQALNPKLDLLKEIKPVCRLSQSPFIAVVRTGSPFKTLKEMIAYAQANPGKLNYGSGGLGSPAHFAVEAIEDILGQFKVVHVPYKGAAEAGTAVIAGDIDFLVGVAGSLLPFIQSGKLRALGITSRKRWSGLPDVPTMSEAGVPGFAMEPWGGIALPAGTPEAIAKRLEEAFRQAMLTPPVIELMQKTASVADFAGPADFANQIARAIETDKGLVKKLGMTTGG